MGKIPLTKKRTQRCPQCRGTGYLDAATSEVNSEYRSLRTAQVDWYLRYGKYPRERIATDSSGVQYVIGDWAWNRKYPHYYETVEGRMP